MAAKKSSLLDAARRTLVPFCDVERIERNRTEAEQHRGLAAKARAEGRLDAAEEHERRASKGPSPADLEAVENHYAAVDEILGFRTRQTRANIEVKRARREWKGEGPDPLLEATVLIFSHESGYTSERVSDHRWYGALREVRELAALLPGLDRLAMLRSVEDRYIASHVVGDATLFNARADNAARIAELARELGARLEDAIKQMPRFKNDVLKAFDKPGKPPVIVLAVIERYCAEAGLSLDEIARTVVELRREGERAEQRPERQDHFDKAHRERIRKRIAASRERRKQHLAKEREGLERLRAEGVLDALEALRASRAERRREEDAAEVMRAWHAGRKQRKESPL